MVDRLDADLTARVLLSAHVDGRGLVLAHEDGREPDGQAELLDLARDVRADAGGELLTVHECGSQGGASLAVHPTGGCEKACKEARSGDGAM